MFTTWYPIYNWVYYTQKHQKHETGPPSGWKIHGKSQILEVWRSKNRVNGARPEFLCPGLGPLFLCVRVLFGYPLSGKLIEIDILILEITKEIRRPVMLVGSKNPSEIKVGRLNRMFPMVFLWFSYGFPMVFPWFSPAPPRPHWGLKLVSYQRFLRMSVRSQYYSCSNVKSIACSPNPDPNHSCLRKNIF